VTLDAEKTVTASFRQLSTHADLSALSVSGTLQPPFSSDITDYTIAFFTDSSATVTATAADPVARLTANKTPIGEQMPISSGQPFEVTPLNPWQTIVSIVATAEDGITTRTYRLTINKLLPSNYIKAVNAGANDQFGTRVAFDGDTLAVSAPEEDSSATGINSEINDNLATNSGAVYIFTRSGTAWVQQAYIKASNAEANDRFGMAIALSGNTLTVSAIGEDSSATGIDKDQNNNDSPGSGAVYIFTRAGSTWTQQSYIKASNTDPSDQFGESIALDGDTLVVGSSREDSLGDPTKNDAGDVGAAYVFTRSQDTWVQEAYIKASNAGNSDFFSSSLSIFGDTLVVGAYVEGSDAKGTWTTTDGSHNNDNAPVSGAVYVFIRVDHTWTQQAYIKASNTEIGDHFGISVALFEDTLAVGALEGSSATGINGNQMDNMANRSGAIYVFRRSETIWVQEAYIKASNTGALDQFCGKLGGAGIAISENTLLIGAFTEDSKSTGINGDQADNSMGDSGAAYLFTRVGTTWTQQAYIKASNTGRLDHFGYSVALAGSQFAVAAWQEDSTGINGDQADNSLTDSGAVYVFE
jgi:hypothetical protein